MNVTLTDGVAPAAALPERHADTDARHLRWRAELERAQWQARQRYSPARVAARGPAAEPPVAGRAGAQAVAQAATRDAAAPAARLARVASRGGVLPSRSPAAPPAALRAAATDAAAAEPAALPGAAVGAWRSGSQGLAVRSPAAPVAPSRLPFELPDWPTQSAQVCLDGRRLSVVLRDAQLAEVEWPALRERLAAQCRACGLELVELMINGVPVEPVAPVA